MHVVNRRKWLRAKRIFTFAWFMTTLGLAGGLEGDKAVSGAVWLMLVPIPFLVHNITKESN